MKTRMRLIPVLLLAAFIALVMPEKAQAVGIASGTSIANRATVDYKVQTVAQSQMGSAPGAGNSTPGNAGSDTTFLVDDKVIFTIVSNDAAQVTTFPGSAPGATGVALKFTVTNSGNTTHDFALSTIAGAANDADFTTTAMYDDSGATPGSYDATDAVITYIDEMPADGTQVIYIVATVAVTAVDGDVAEYALKAVAHAGGGAGVQGAITTANSGSADTTGSVDVVLADADSDGLVGPDYDSRGVDGTNAIAGVQLGANNGSYNGEYVMWSGGSAGNPEPPTKGYKVSGAKLTISKTSAVVSDPINGSTNPKAIPGATVEYTITITNGAGAATATNIAISDNIDGNTTASTSAYGAGLGVSVNFNGGGAVLDTSAADGNDTSTYGGEFVGGVVGVGAGSGPANLSLTASQNVVIKYQVTIN